MSLKFTGFHWISDRNVPGRESRSPSVNTLGVDCYVFVNINILTICVAFFASPYLKIAFDLRGEKIITGNKIPDSRTWKSGSKYSALVRGGPEGALAQRP